MAKNTIKAKACWVSTETRNGWRLAFFHGNRRFPVRGLLLSTREDVEKALDSRCVYVFLANSQEKAND